MKYILKKIERKDNISINIIISITKNRIYINLINIIVEFKLTNIVNLKNYLYEVGLISWVKQNKKINKYE